LIALSKHNIKYQCYTLNKNQSDVVNHLNGEKISEKRNLMTESARIARGDVKDLKDLIASEYEVSS